MDHAQKLEPPKKHRTPRNKKWSEFMSPEAQIAMQLALEDTRAMKLATNSGREWKADQDKVNNGGNRSPTRVAFADRTDDTSDESNTKSTSEFSRELAPPRFTQLFERNGSARMRHDVTDESYSEESELKRALGGGKVESAMEIVEIVNHDADPSSLDDRAIEELAKINSVDKCAVWIEATQAHQEQQLPNIPEAEHESKDS